MEKTSAVHLLHHVFNLVLHNICGPNVLQTLGAESSPGAIRL